MRWVPGDTACTSLQAPHVSAGSEAMRGATPERFIGRNMDHQDEVPARHADFAAVERSDQVGPRELRVTERLERFDELLRAGLTPLTLRSALRALSRAASGSRSTAGYTPYSRIAAV